MVRTVLFMTAPAAVTLGLTGCTGGSAPDRPAPATTTTATVPANAAGPTSRLANDPETAGCWWALHDEYVPGTAQLQGDAATLPPACAGLNPDDIPDVRNDVLSYLGKSR